MNRRSFLGLACGGVVAAPMAAHIVGESASGQYAVVGESDPGLVNLPTTQVVKIHGVGGSDTHIHKLVEQHVRAAMNEYWRNASRGTNLRS